MIVVADVDPNTLTTYHEDCVHALDNVAKIKAAGEYTSLKSNISKDGILDPIVVRCEPGRMYVETGEQRVLIARELSIPTIKAIIYTTNGAKLPVQFSEAKVLATKQEIDNEFSRTEYTVTRREKCPICGRDNGEVEKTIPVPAYKQLNEYIDAGIAVRQAKEK